MSYVRFYKKNNLKFLTIKAYIIEPKIWEIAVNLHKEFNASSQESLINHLSLERDRLYKKIEATNQKIDKLLIKINRIEERWLDDKITNEKRDELREQTESEIISLQNDKKHMGLEISDKNNQITKLRNRKRIDYNNLTYDEKVSIIKDVIKVVYVSRISYISLLLKVHNKYNDRIDEIVFTYHRTKRD